MSQSLGRLEIELTANSDKLKREIEQTERVVKQRSEGMSNSLKQAFSLDL